jgi:hypothetical protein
LDNGDEDLGTDKYRVYFLFPKYCSFSEKETFIHREIPSQLPYSGKPFENKTAQYLNFQWISFFLSKHGKIYIVYIKSLD